VLAGKITIPRILTVPAIIIERMVAMSGLEPGMMYRDVQMPREARDG
jgi:hypothetical protein